MKKAIIIVAALVIGAIITAGVDALLGINLYKDVGTVFSIIHNITYMAWGGIIIALAE